jgi:hypothetical protein
LLRTFAWSWTSRQWSVDVRSRDDADPEEELFFCVQQRQTQQLLRVIRAAATHWGLDSQVGDKFVSALFLIDYVGCNKDEVWELQVGI